MYSLYWQIFRKSYVYVYIYSSIVYKACLISGNAANNYCGCEAEFKACFYCPNQSSIKGRLTPPNSLKLSGRPRTRKKTFFPLLFCVT